MDELQIVRGLEKLGGDMKQMGNDYERTVADFIAGGITADGFIERIRTLIGSCREIERRLKEIIPFTRGAAKRNIKDCIGMSREMVKLMKQSINMAQIIGTTRNEGVKK